MVNYLTLIKKSIKITWKNKFLWIFGLFAGGAIGISNFSNNASWNMDSTSEITDQLSVSLNFLKQNISVISWIAILIAVLVLFWFVLSIISQGSLIEAVSGISREKEHNFHTALTAGKRYGLKIFGLSVVIFLVMLLLLIFLIIPVVLLAVSQFYIYALILFGINLIIYMICIVFIDAFSQMAQRFIVVNRQSVFKSMSSAYLLTTKQLKNITLMILVIWVINIMLIITVFLALLFLAIFLFFIGVALYNLVAVNVLVYTAITALFIIILSVFATSVINTFFSSFWTLFWLKIHSIETSKLKS